MNPLDQIKEESDSAGIRLLPPFVFEVLSVNWWTSKVMWAYVNFNLVSWMQDLYGSMTTQGKELVPDLATHSNFQILIL